MYYIYTAKELCALFSRISKNHNNPTEALKNECRELGRNLKELQDTVPFFGDQPWDKLCPLSRACILYLRPKLVEEPQFYKLMKEELALEPGDENWDKCLPGPGANKSDFYGKDILDPNNPNDVGYDVKHALNAKHAHDAKYLVKFNGCNIEFYLTSEIKMAANIDAVKPVAIRACKPLGLVTLDLGIDLVVVNANSLSMVDLEKALEEYLFFI